MKEKKKYIAIAVLFLTAILGLIGCLYALGFRITYAPKLENSWTAVSACAAWAGAIATTAAVFTAIWIPKRIADRQDKIALFEKRFECYSEIQKLLGCANRLKTINTNEDTVLVFKIWLGSDVKPIHQMSDEEIEVKLAQIKQLILSGGFLFPEYDLQLAKEMLRAAENVFLMTSLGNSKMTKTPLIDEQINLIDEFVNLSTQFKDRYITAMEKELGLNEH